MTISKERKKDAFVVCDLLEQTTKDILGHCMVIVTNYELIENPQTGFFM